MALLHPPSLFLGQWHALVSRTGQTRGPRKHARQDCRFQTFEITYRPIILQRAAGALGLCPCYATNGYSPILDVSEERQCLSYIASTSTWNEVLKQRCWDFTTMVQSRVHAFPGLLWPAKA